MRNSIFLLISIAIAAANGQYYLIQIEEFHQANFTSTLRCSGAYFNETDIVIPASCIDGLTQEQIRVRMVQPTGNSVISTAHGITGFEVHHKYDAGNPELNNIAVVKHVQRNALFQPRDLSRIPAETTQCTLHGLIRRGNTLVNWFNDPVTVYPPSMCGFTDPHAHCAVFNSTIHRTCEFGIGSPLTCDGNTTAGFLFNSNGCTRRNFTDQFGNVSLMPMLRFTSMSLFDEWMDNNDDNGSGFLKGSLAGVIVVALVGLIVGV